MTLAERERARGQTLEHPALVYRRMDEFLAHLVPFVEEGVRRRQPVFVAVGSDELAALRAEVAVENGVRWADTKEWHPDPATRLRAFHVFVTDELEGGSTRIRLVGEPLWPDGPTEFAREWARYESVLNAVLAPFPVTLVCTYDASRLDPDIVADAHRTHPIVWADRRSRPSAAFEDPSVLLARWNPPLALVPRSAHRLREPNDLTAARAFVGAQALGAGLSTDRADDVVLATSEVVANASSRGGGPVSVRCWVSAGYLLCQIDDEGPGVNDVLAGYRPPTGDQESGRGLWLARQLVDLLQVVSGPGGTAVRLHVALP